TYGDGFFETVITEKGKGYFFEDHFERLTQAFKSFYMKMPPEFNADFFQKKIETLCDKNNLEKMARVKIMVWRKPGGLFTPETNEIDYLITTSEFNPSPVFKERVMFYDDIRTGFSIVSPFKTLNALTYVMASVLKNNIGADDMVLLDREGNISECTAANIFF